MAQQTLSCLVQTARRVRNGVKQACCRADVMSVGRCRPRCAGIALLRPSMRDRKATVMNRHGVEMSGSGLQTNFVNTVLAVGRDADHIVVSSWASFRRTKQ